MAGGESRARASNDVVWNLDIKMHLAQKEIYDSPARFRIVAAGRRFGKTHLAATLVILAAIAKPNAECWWVSPSHAQSQEALRYIASVLPKESREVNLTKNEIYLASGGRICFKSAENRDNLRGSGLDFVVIDEAAFVEQGVWTSVIRPMLADKKGKAFLISTFDGENWFWDLWRAAANPTQTSWASFMFHSSANPFLGDEEIEDMRNSMTKEEFEQECECSPISFVGAVFDGHALVESIQLGNNEALMAEANKRDQNGKPIRYAEAGLDWGWNVTAFEVAVDIPRRDADDQLVFVHEAIYEQIELTEKCEHIAALCRYYDIAIIYADAADPSSTHTLANILEAQGLDTVVQPVGFAEYKMPAIRTRSLFLRRGREAMGPTCVGLIRDSKAYRYDKNDDRKPAKGNDHTVDAATALYAGRINDLSSLSYDTSDLTRDD